ncbi:MAG: (Fe-S)-binding protein [Chloroflexi bacterium]|nr:(Fe-S)-binding protein [Chloroflexota bacterium]MBM4451920.1 (Fe-S)-binding protein [Chloroflexota bacterium]
MSPNVALYAVIFLAALAFFGWSCYRRFRFVTLGKPDNRFDDIGRRFWYMLLYAFGQRRVVGRPFGINHFVLFWCFMILLLANTEFLFNGLFPDYISLSKLPLVADYALSFIFDVASLFALLAVCLAILRRLAFPPSYIDARSRDAFIILSLVGALMIAFFGLNASEIAHGLDNPEVAKYMPVSNFIAQTIFQGLQKVPLAILATIFWWVHALVLLAFLNYLPYSKHMHIMTSIPNCFFRSLGKVTTQPREEFNKGNVFGVGQVDQFTWKGLFDSYSCTECGRCSDVCPATSTGKTLNPRLVIYDIKTNLLHNGPQLGKNGKKDAALPLIGGGHEGSVAEDVLWACTTCSACMEVCPVFIEHVPRMVDMRRNLVEMRAKFPEELLSFFENMEQRSNPWGIAPGDRAKWASELDVKHFEAGTEYLFYVGCYGAFDARSRRVSAAMASILNKAGVSWGILGKDELCCGDSLRRLGNEYVFDQMVKANIKLFTDKGVKKVITQCPHCFSTLKHDYRQYGIELEVIHHTEFIEQLLRDNRLKLNGAVDLGNIVFHDSCYLGRYNQIYQAPRHVISAVTGHKPLEMKRHRENSFCCGAGGGRMWLEESTPKKIYQARTEEALEHDPSAICVCCPYCMTMFEDGLKDKGALGRVNVLDLAEIVERALQE